VDSRAFGLLRSYKVHTIFWLSVAMIDWLEWLIIQILTNGKILENFPEAVLYTTWPFWIVFGPIVVKFTSRYPFQSKGISKNIIRHVLFGVLIIFSLIALQALVMIIASYLFFKVTDTITVLPRFFLLTFNIRMFTYLFIVALAQGVSYFETIRRIEIQNSKLQAQVADAKLKTLHMQIQPHFLFNTHQAIAGLMLKNQIEKASEMLSCLSTLLRQTLVVQQEQFIPLRQELTIVKEYLNIQQIRFHDRLVVSIAEPVSLLWAKIPPFILQPLIENAIQHGFAPYSDSRLVEVNVYQESGRLVITVRDDGGGVKHSQGRKGIGLQNVRARLEEYYPNNYLLTLKNHDVKGAIATLALPLQFIYGKVHESHPKENHEQVH
jgi:two-component system, LytTR family, sensor kinase